MSSVSNTRLALALVATTAASVTVLATHHHHRRPARVASARLASVTPISPRASRSHTREPLGHVKTPRARPRLVVVPADILDWHALALCESTDNPHAVDPSGTHYGLYQFDILTWRSVGGRGNPADASRAEQTLRARILYGQRGRAPWPVCGVRL